MYAHGWTPTKARGPRPKTLAAAVLLCLCVTAWLATSGAAGGTLGAHTSFVAPLGGVNVAGVAGNLPPSLADRKSRAHTHCKRSSCASKCRGPHSNPALRARSNPRSCLSRPPRERRREGRHQGDRNRRQHTLLGLLGPGIPAAQVCGGAVNRSKRLASTRTVRVRSLRRLPRHALRQAPGGDRGVERARPGQRSLLRGAGKTTALRRRPACGLPCDQAGQPEREGARRLARRLQRRLPARTLRSRHQGLLRRSGGPFLHPHARLAAGDPRNAAGERGQHAAVAG